MEKNIIKLLGPLQNRGLEDELKANRYYQIVANVMKHIHDQIPEARFDTTKVATSTDIREEFFNGKNYRRAVIYLMSGGCEWAIKSGNGCSMCGHLSKQERKNNLIPAQHFIKQFQEEFDKIDFKENPLLNLYNNGSFFNERELPLEARTFILNKINQDKHIKMLVVETRPEYVTEEKIKEFKRLVPHLPVEVAIGLEIKDNFYRRLCLNKGFSRETYKKAVDIVTRYTGIRTYVFLKPPFLTEKESIQNAVETVDYAFENGAITVSLEACTIQDHTLVKYLHEYGLYRTPWLWSIIEVVKRAGKKGKLIVGEFQFYPQPHEVPFNCDACSQLVLQGIKKYNRTLDVSALETPDCPCKEKWREEINGEPPTLSKRLEDSMRELTRKIPGITSL